MTICKHFLAGRCHFGANCRFEHSLPNRGGNNVFGRTGQQQGHSGGGGSFGRDNQNYRSGSKGQGGFGGRQSLSNKQEEESYAESLTKLAQQDLSLGISWPFSCYAPERNFANILTGDVSFEELRWQCLQEVQGGVPVAQHIARVAQMSAEYMAKKNDTSANALFLIETALENPSTAAQTPSMAPVPAPFGQAAATPPQSVFGASIHSGGSAAPPAFARAPTSVPLTPLAPVGPATQPAAGMFALPTAAPLPVSTLPSTLPSSTLPLPSSTLPLPSSTLSLPSSTLPTALVGPAAPGPAHTAGTEVPEAWTTQEAHVMHAYQSAAFEFRRIPEVPPPPELC